MYVQLILSGDTPLLRVPGAGDGRHYVTRLHARLEAKAGHVDVEKLATVALRDQRAAELRRPPQHHVQVQLCTLILHEVVRA